MYFLADPVIHPALFLKVLRKYDLFARTECHHTALLNFLDSRENPRREAGDAVSYTHLTLPTRRTV